MRVLLGLILPLLLSACSAPGLLSTLDGVSGGGRGTRRVAQGVAFGAHGQKLDVWRPGLPGPGKRPVVIFWYGGSWATGDRAAYAFAARAFASRGFVVVVPDYRKVPAVRFPAFVEDGADAVRWTRDHIAEHGGDPDRIAVAGHSAGAYIAVMLALDPRFLAGAGVAPGTIRAGIGLSGPYAFLPFSGAAIPAFAGAADPERTQPIRFARADAPPLLLATGTDDSLVRPRNAERLAAALQAAGASVELRRYPGLGHADTVMALSRPFRGKAAILDEAVAFLNGALPSR